MKQEICRPQKHLNDISNKYPDVWQYIDQKMATKNELPNGYVLSPDNSTMIREINKWPDWCFFPTGCFSSYLSRYYQKSTIESQVDMAYLSALSIWRNTRGIYRFDPEIYKAVRKMDIKGALPVEVLRQLPEWCVYIETPGEIYATYQLYGFFAFLNYNDKGTKSREELCIVRDTAWGLIREKIDLSGTLEESVTKSVTGSLEAHCPDVSKLPAYATKEKMIDYSLETLPSLISLLLYLCSVNAEIGEGKIRPEKPKPKKTKKGLRVFQSKKINTWNVGIRMGAKLRRFNTNNSKEEYLSGTVRPHVRVAHWHGYWTGPRNSDNRQFNLKWLPPILVKEDKRELPTVVRKVE